MISFFQTIGRFFEMQFNMFRGFLDFFKLIGDFFSSLGSFLVSGVSWVFVSNYSGETVDAALAMGAGVLQSVFGLMLAISLLLAIKQIVPLL